MKVKIISVPTTLEAMSRLDVDSCIDDDLVEVVLSQEEFDKLWLLGFFDCLNKELGLLIDDFESEEIAYQDVDKALGVLDLYFNKTNDKGECLLEMKKLFQLAKDSKTGVFFFF